MSWFTDLLVNAATGKLSDAQVAAEKAQTAEDIRRAGGSTEDVQRAMNDIDATVRLNGGTSNSKSVATEIIFIGIAVVAVIIFSKAFGERLASKVIK